MQTTDFVGTLFEGKGNPGKVTVAFVMACNAVQKGHSATLILMVDAVELALPDATRDIDIGAPFKPVGELLDTYLAAGGRIAVCQSCLLHHGFTPEQVDSRYQIITAGDVIDLVMGAKGTLQVS